MFDAVAQVVHLSPDKVQMVPLLLTLLQTADPVRESKVRGQVDGAQRTEWVCFDSLPVC